MAAATHLMPLHVFLVIRHEENGYDTGVMFLPNDKSEVAVKMAGKGKHWRTSRSEKDILRYIEHTEDEDIRGKSIIIDSVITDYWDDRCCCVDCVA
jgi:hypothetical protein